MDTSSLFVLRYLSMNGGSSRQMSFEIITKGDENTVENLLVLFASFVVKPILACGLKLRCVLFGESSAELK